MNTLIPDLFSLTLEHFPAPSDDTYQTCQALRERHFSTVQAGLGADFAAKLRDTLDELGQLERERAFLQGLHLGLALNRL